MKNKIIQLSFIILLFNLFIVSGCKKTYQVTFKVDNEIYQQIDVKKNQTVEQIINPEKQNYVFKGWYENEQLFDFNTKIKKDTQLNAKFQIICVLEGHTYDNQCDETCNICFETRNVSHDFTQATYTAPKTCKICGKTEGEVKPKPSSVKVESSKLVLYIGDTYQFNPVVLPQEVSQDVKYTLKTSNGAEATITEDGKLTVTHEGKVYVNISSKELSYIGTTITIEVLHPLIENEAYDAFNIMTGYGSDASTQVEINYHTHNIYTKVEYTLATDPTFTQFSEATGEGYYFTEGVDQVTIPFPGRNVYRVSIKDLEPNTKYIYRINQGNNTYSKTYSFVTAKNDGSESAFIVLSDVHYHANTNEDGTFESHGSEISETMIEKLLEQNSNINMIATLGDMVDTGGNANTWSVFFDKSTSLQTLARIGVAGNHEYYISGTGQSDGKYQKAHFATPYNGPSTQLGLSGYVVYNDILIILIDNEDASGRKEMLEWLDDILTNVKYRYSIAMMHSPVYYEDSESSNKDRDEKMLAIFDKHSVDLVMAGHYHGHRVRADYYNGSTSTDSGLGVNYMTASFGGVKSRSDSNLAKGYIVETKDGVITLKYFDENGTLLQTYTFNSKRNQPFEKETKENLISSITSNYDETTNQFIIQMSNKFYGNVKSLEIEETLRGEIKDNMVFPTPSYNKLVIKNLTKNYQYNFKITINFADGTKHIMYQELDLATNINMNPTNITSNMIQLDFISAADSMLYMIKEYEVFVNNEKHSVFNYLDNYDDPVLTYQIDNLKPNTEYEICFVAKDYKGKIIYQYQITVKTK